VTDINYISEWIRIFHQVLGWSPYKTLQWIENHHLERNGDDFVTREMPMYWAIPEFIPIKLRRQLGAKEILTIQNDIWQLYVLSTTYGQPNSNYKLFRGVLNRYLEVNYQIELDAPANV
jgi:hypothetical protein